MFGTRPGADPSARPPVVGAAFTPAERVFVREIHPLAPTFFRSFARSRIFLADSPAGAPRGIPIVRNRTPRKAMRVASLQRGAPRQ